MSSPSRATILRRLDSQTDPFNITPMPAPRAVGRGTVDLSLGHIFMVAMRSATPMISVRDKGAARKLFSEVQLRGDDPLIIHPRQFRARRLS